MTITRHLPRIVTALVAVALLACAALSASPAGAAKSKNCPKEHGTLATSPFGPIWHHGSSLYGCSNAYDHGPKIRRLGPWTTGTKFAYNRTSVVWTVRKTVNGVVSDRAWAIDTDGLKAWLSGTPLIPVGKGQPFKNGRVQKLYTESQGAGWVTTTGQVVMALREPDEDPTTIGTLPSPLVTVKQLTLIGTFTSVPAATLAASVQFKELEGDGDECGGSNPWSMTLIPSSGAARIGAKWDGSWQSTGPGCT